MQNFSSSNGSSNQNHTIKIGLGPLEGEIKALTSIADSRQYIISLTHTLAAAFNLTSIDSILEINDELAIVEKINFIIDFLQNMEPLKIIWPHIEKLTKNNQGNLSEDIKKIFIEYFTNLAKNGAIDGNAATSVFKEIMVEIGKNTDALSNIKSSANLLEKVNKIFVGRLKDFAIIQSTAQAELLKNSFLQLRQLRREYEKGGLIIFFKENLSNISDSNGNYVWLGFNSSLEKKLYLIKENRPILIELNDEELFEAALCKVKVVHSKALPKLGTSQTLISKEKSKIKDFFGFAQKETKHKVWFKESLQNLDLNKFNNCYIALGFHTSKQKELYFIQNGQPRLTSLEDLGLSDDSFMLDTTKQEIITPKIGEKKSFKHDEIKNSIISNLKNAMDPNALESYKQLTEISLPTPKIISENLYSNLNILRKINHNNKNQWFINHLDKVSTKMIQDAILAIYIRTQYSDYSQTIKRSYLMLKDIQENPSLFKNQIELIAEHKQYNGNDQIAWLKSLTVEEISQKELDSLLISHFFKLKLSQPNLAIDENNLRTILVNNISLPAIASVFEELISEAWNDHDLLSAFANDITTQDIQAVILADYKNNIKKILENILQNAREIEFSQLSAVMTRTKISNPSIASSNSNAIVSISFPEPETTELELQNTNQNSPHNSSSNSSSNSSLTAKQSKGQMLFIAYASIITELEKNLKGIPIKYLLCSHNESDLSLIEISLLKFIFEENSQQKEIYKNDLIAQIDSQKNKQIDFPVILGKLQQSEQNILKKAKNCQSIADCSPILWKLATIDQNYLKYLNLDFEISAILKTIHENIKTKTFNLVDYLLEYHSSILKNENLNQIPMVDHLRQLNFDHINQVIGLVKRLEGFRAIFAKIADIHYNFKPQIQTELEQSIYLLTIQGFDQSIQTILTKYDFNQIQNVLIKFDTALASIQTKKSQFESKLNRLKPSLVSLDFDIIDTYNITSPDHKLLLSFILKENKTDLDTLISQYPFESGHSITLQSCIDSLTQNTQKYIHLNNIVKDLTTLKETSNLTKDYSSKDLRRNDELPIWNVLESNEENIELNIKKVLSLLQNPQNNQMSVVELIARFKSGQMRSILEQRSLIWTKVIKIRNLLAKNKINIPANNNPEIEQLIIKTCNCSPNEIEHHRENIYTLLNAQNFTQITEILSRLETYSFNTASNLIKSEHLKQQVLKIRNNFKLTLNLPEQHLLPNQLVTLLKAISCNTSEMDHLLKSLAPINEDAFLMYEQFLKGIDASKGAGIAEFFEYIPTLIQKTTQFSTLTNNDIEALNLPEYMQELLYSLRSINDNDKNVLPIINLMSFPLKHLTKADPNLNGTKRLSAEISTLTEIITETLEIKRSQQQKIHTLSNFFQQRNNRNQIKNFHNISITQMLLLHVILEPNENQRFVLLKQIWQNEGNLNAITDTISILEQNINQDLRSTYGYQDQANSSIYDENITKHADQVKIYLKLQDQIIKEWLLAEKPTENDITLFEQLIKQLKGKAISSKDNTTHQILAMEPFSNDKEKSPAKTIKSLSTINQSHLYHYLKTKKINTGITSKDMKKCWIKFNSEPARSKEKYGNLEKIQQEHSLGKSFNPEFLKICYYYKLWQSALSSNDSKYDWVKSMQDKNLINTDEAYFAAKI